MIHPRWLGALAVCCGAIASGVAQGHIVHFWAPLSGSQVVPPTASFARGSAYLALDHHSGFMDLTVIVDGLSVEDFWPGGPNGHSAFLGIGDMGKPGDYVFDLQWLGATFHQQGDGVRLDLEGMLLGGEQGDLSSSVHDNVEALFADRMYIELLTDAYPGGELRGQFHFIRPRSISQLPHAGPTPTPGSAVAIVLGMGVAFRRRR